MPLHLPSRSGTPAPVPDMTQSSSAVTPSSNSYSAVENRVADTTPASSDNAKDMISLAKKAGPEESLRAYRLLEALRAGDEEAIKPLLEASRDSARVAPAGSDANTACPLHVAVRTAKHPIVELVLNFNPAWVNAQDGRGQTPLHLAAALNRVDIVALFLLQDSVDDMIRDFMGKTAADVAGGPDTSTLISVSRSRYNEAYQALFAAYVASPASTSSNRQSTTSATPAGPQEGHSSSNQVSAASGHVSNSAAEQLYHYIARPRSRCINFASRDQATGTTLLHEAVRRKDLGLIKIATSKGADVLVRDKRGKRPIDFAKDDRIKSVLQQVTSKETDALRKAAGSPPSTTAPLIGGSPPAMRGYLHKWTNMARGYRSRWFVLDNGVLSYYRTQEDEGKASRGSINMSVAIVSGPNTDKLKFNVDNKLGKSFPSFYLKGNHPVEVMRWVELLRQNVEFARGGATLSRTHSAMSSHTTSLAPSIDERQRRTSETPSKMQDNARGSPAESFEQRDPSIIGDDETFNGEGDTVPRADDFELLAQSTKTQLELTQQLLDSLVIRDDNVGTLDSSRPSSIRSDGTNRQADVKEALRGSMASLSNILDEYIEVVADRERYFVRKYEREIDAKRMWEDNMKEVAAQHAAIEAELQRTSRENTRRKRALQEVRANLGSPLASPVTGPTSDAQLAEDGSSSIPASPLGSPAVARDGGRSRGATLSAVSPNRGRLRAGTVRTLKPEELEAVVDSALAPEDGAAADSDSDDDEFYEAVEQGQISVTDEPHNAEERNAAEIKKYDLEPYRGYENLRNKLPLSDDTRPPVSLWAILKGSIGKDLTKISFPVFFNEPCSMLQRMAEDIEFSECLDGAASDPDSTKRIAYVAAFAASNYSSTIGRSAKPFNPMLGETFEYVSLDKKYRYVSEQVSHHPPISACIAESPSWRYYGEVDAKSKFLGKSFEIRPTGVAHATLLIPKEWGPDLPSAGDHHPDMVEEHYSWTKVTTSVSNFLFGNPIIDHYGDMVITNHRNGDQCTLTFKPRGWRGSGACEIKGKVVDAKGKEHWDIAGKWSTQLIARRAGVGSGELAPDASIPASSEYIRLWKNSEKPPGMPFNLTPFAITLNDDNPALKKWLPPTDCRLRPDQHAFEKGKFEHANNLKSELEEHQRATRRKREQGQLPPHKPRWFRHTKDTDTGESYWEPAKASDGMLEYWTERTRVGNAKLAGETTEWKDVDPIFGDFQS